VPWLTENGSVHVTVERIPDQYPLGAPQVVYSQDLGTSAGAVTVPVTFQAAHDAFAVYVTPAGATGGDTGGEVHAVGAGKCLDVPNGSTTAGTQLQIWDCSGATQQVFTRTADGRLTVYSGSDLMCLDANGRGTTAGTEVIIWPCNGQANQQWTVNSDGTVTGAASGLCLDVTGASTADGARVELWGCNGGSNQQWRQG
jgi:hypothetical protein